MIERVLVKTAEHPFNCETCGGLVVEQDLYYRHIRQTSSGDTAHNVCVVCESVCYAIRFSVTERASDFLPSAERYFQHYHSKTLPCTELGKLHPIARAWACNVLQQHQEPWEEHEGGPK